VSPGAARIDTFEAELRTDTPLVATARPRLTWTVRTGEPGWEQVSAQVRRGQEVVSLPGAESVLVDWPFAPLAPGERTEVEVRATAVSGTATPWSSPLGIVAGFLAEGDWVAQPIGLADPQRAAQPVLLRTEFQVAAPVRRATLVWTALGVAEVELNGRLVDDGVLAPGWTSYRDRLVHEFVDVTDLVRAGRNAIGIRLAGGWYTEAYGFHGLAKPFYGEQPSVLAQVVLEEADGTRSVVASDGSWRASDSGPVVTSGIYRGETFDARLHEPGWSEPGFTGGWPAARVGGARAPTPQARIAPPVRRIEELAVAAVLPTPSGGQVLDFGQNLVGWLRIRVRGERGHRVTLRHAEVLEDGELALRPLRLADATDTYVLAGADAEGAAEPEVWEPRFTFHGFRYAQVENWPGDFDPADVTAVVVHTDLDRTGTFTSSHSELNRLHENVVWGMRGNFLSIPTDCPQRDERLGWTGDIQVFAPTASFLYDVRGFLTSWLRDLALEQQRLDGAVPLVVPSVLDSFGPGLVAAWGDAATVVPWVLHERYGDTGVLRDAYPSMRAWVETLLVESRGTGLWAGTFQLGDWLDPAAPPDKPAAARTATDIVASAYLARSLQIVADAATVLGADEDATRFAAEAARARTAFAREYVTPAGRMMSDAPTAYALALQFRLVSEPATRIRLAARLAELVREDGYRIGTGFVGTPLVADALSESGHLAVAARLLLQTECPSWLYPVTMGATTIWERWDSLLPDGTVNPGEMTSFNHYALGAVADWLHRVVAGLAPAEPGYRLLRIGTRPLPGLDHAAATLRTPYGPAAVSWRRDGDRVVLDAQVPPNARAVVDLPGVPSQVVGSGTHTWTFAVEPPPRSHRPLDLDSPTAHIIDDPEAYDAVLDAIGRIDPERLTSFRQDTVWSHRRTLRQALMLSRQALTDEVDAALAELEPRADARQGD